MKTIVQIKFGSHLYGTSTPASDLDIKGVYLPSSRDILLQTIKEVVSFKRDKMEGEKNTSQDVDFELYSVKKFLDLLAQGQTVALDMLFAPESAMMIEPSPEWDQIKKFAPKLFTKQASSFLGYCRHQANKYGIKGSRIASAKRALDYIADGQRRYGHTARLGIIEDRLELIVNEFLILKDDVFEICGKKALLSAPIKSACAIAQKLVDDYGERALSAQKNENIDWKALSHAVRVGYEAIEFLKTGHITFPRPEASHLLDIKLGKFTFYQVGDEIEQLLVDVEDATKASNLQDNFDQNLIDDFILELHLKEILEHSSDS